MEIGKVWTIHCIGSLGLALLFVIAFGYSEINFVTIWLLMFILFNQIPISLMLSEKRCRKLGKGLKGGDRNDRS